MHKSIFTNHRLVFFGTETSSAIPKEEKPTTVASLPTATEAATALTDSQGNLKDAKRKIPPEGQPAYQSTAETLTPEPEVANAATREAEEQALEAKDKATLAGTLMFQANLGNLENMLNLGDTEIRDAAIDGSQSSLRLQYQKGKIGLDLKTTLQPFGEGESFKPLQAFAFNGKYGDTSFAFETSPVKGNLAKISQKLGPVSLKYVDIKKPDGTEGKKGEIFASTKTDIGNVGAGLGVKFMDDGTRVLSPSLQAGHLIAEAEINLENLTPEAIQAIKLKEMALTATILQPTALGLQKMTVVIVPGANLITVKIEPQLKIGDTTLLASASATSTGKTSITDFNRETITYSLGLGLKHEF